MLSHLPEWSEVSFPGFVTLIFGVWGIWIAVRDRRREILALYVNGQLEGVARRPSPLMSATVLAQIGRGEATDLAGNPFSGLIDELTIYNGALTACEIKNIFNGKPGR